MNDEVQVRDEAWQGHDEFAESIAAIQQRIERNQEEANRLRVRRRQMKRELDRLQEKLTPQAAVAQGTP
jgi:hypothetical protein